MLQPRAPSASGFGNGTALTYPPPIMTARCSQVARDRRWLVGNLYADACDARFFGLNFLLRWSET
jgi:hypothetical protein